MLPRIDAFRTLAALLLVLHAYVLAALGATFWYDSIVYVSMGHDIWEHGLDDFYSGQRALYFGHVGPGAGFLWIVLVKLLGSQAWLGLAVLQHGLAWLATLYFLDFFRDQLPRWAIFLAGIVLSLHPFLRAFDNAILTESLTLSLLLLAAGAGLRLLYSAGTRWTPVLLVLSACLGIQFRNNFLLFGLSIIGLVTLRQLLQTRSARVVGVGLVQALLLAISYAGFPGVRWLATGEFFLPACGPVLLSHALSNNPQPSAAFWDAVGRDERLAGFDLKRMAEEKNRDGRSRYLTWVELATSLHQNGLSVRETHQLLSGLAGRLQIDNGQAFVNHLSLGAATVGFTSPDRWLPADHEIQRDTAPATFRERNEFYYRWFGWTAVSDYAGFLGSFTRRNRTEAQWYSPAAVDCLENGLRPYLHSRGLRKRDPLHLMAIPPELWALGGLLGLALLLRERFWGGLLLLGIVVCNFAVCSYAGLGGVRYFHPVLCLYVFCSAYALARVAHLVRLGALYLAPGAGAIARRRRCAGSSVQRGPT